MKKVLASSLVAAWCTAAIYAQDPSTMKPGAEQKRLERFAGSWKMEGTMEASPFGPAGKFSGTERCSMFEGGWHLVCDISGKTPLGDLKGHSLFTYDRSAKQYRSFSVSNMADAELGTGTLTGNTWTWNSKMDGGGQTMHSRFVVVETSPTARTFKWEISMDGKAWKALMNGTSTKSGS